jgi:hypothetical protein
LQPQKALLVTGLQQLVDQGGGGGEADCEALLAGGKTQAQRDVGFAGAGGSSVILPGVRRPRFGSFIRFTRAAARRW